MTRIKMKMFAVVLMSLALLFGPGLANAQAIVSAVSQVQISYQIGESVSVTGVPPSLTFSGSPVPATGPLSVTINWQLAATRTRVDLAVYFATTTALTDGSGHNIPTSSVFANINGGTFSPCNSSAVAPELTASVTAGAVCGANDNVVITSSNLSGSKTDTVVLQLQSLPSLPAGTFTGQVSLIAGAS